MHREPLYLLWIFNRDRFRGIINLDHRFFCCHLKESKHILKISQILVIMRDLMFRKVTSMSPK